MRTATVALSLLAIQVMTANDPFSQAHKGHFQFRPPNGTVWIATTRKTRIERMPGKKPVTTVENIQSRVTYHISGGGRLVTTRILNGSMMRDGKPIPSPYFSGVRGASWTVSLDNAVGPGVGADFQVFLDKISNAYKAAGRGREAESARAFEIGEAGERNWEWHATRIWNRRSRVGTSWVDTGVIRVPMGPSPRIVTCRVSYKVTGEANVGGVRCVNLHFTKRADSQRFVEFLRRRVDIRRFPRVPFDSKNQYATEEGDRLIDPATGLTYKSHTLVTVSYQLDTRGLYSRPALVTQEETLNCRYSKR